MNKTYKVNVNNTFDFELEETDISKLDASKVSNSKFHVLQNNMSFKTEIIDTNFNQKSYKVKVNNNTYNINIVNDLDTLIKEMGFEVGSSKKVNDIKAPMPGLILDISVKIGQEVNEDDTLLILEAMKMENVITSPRQGVIKSISVSKGDAVEKNQLLIEFE
jgi:biotin carboxyl carrier protein